MSFIEWSNDNDGYVDFVGHVSAIQQRRQLLAEQAIQNGLLSEQIEIHREALSIQKQAQLEQQTVATWQDVLFELGEALKLIESHFQVDKHQAYGEWLEVDRIVNDLELHHRLFRDLHWKSLCNATLHQVQHIRDNLDTFISPSQRRAFERNVQKRQKAIEKEQEKLRAEAEREATEQRSILAARRAKRNRVFLIFLTAMAILSGLWAARRWFSLLLIVACAVFVGIFGVRLISSYLQRRRTTQLPPRSTPPLIFPRLVTGRLCANCGEGMGDTHFHCSHCGVICPSCMWKKNKTKRGPLAARSRCPNCDEPMTSKCKK